MTHNMHRNIFSRWKSHEDLYLENGKEMIRVAWLCDVSVDLNTGHTQYNKMNKKLRKMGKMIYWHSKK